MEKFGIQQIGPRDCAGEIPHEKCDLLDSSASTVPPSANAVYRVSAQVLSHEVYSKAVA
ncbi:MAG: hypothetical protein IPP88_07320 [Betaproteobacteria bacterium]|nr:hypothetical protein [Betaproteobacteria bacterium]